MKLPPPRGPLSGTLFEYLTTRRDAPRVSELPRDALADDDLQLALFVAHELHYGGLAGVDDELEWDPALIAFRSALERAMLEPASRRGRRRRHRSRPSGCPTRSSS